MGKLCFCNSHQHPQRLIHSILCGKRIRHIRIQQDQVGALLVALRILASDASLQLSEIILGAQFIT